MAKDRSSVEHPSWLALLPLSAAQEQPDEGFLRSGQYEESREGRWRPSSPVSYSARSIVAGSIRTARITGGSAATSAAARIVNAGRITILGSPGLTW